MPNVFLRSRSGITNFHQFTGTDFTAYCEGGTNQISTSDASLGCCNVSAEDRTYWHAMCRYFAKETKIHFKPIGSCIKLSELIIEIKKINPSNVVVFIDRDWRQYTGGIHYEKFVVYTFSYSWENDVVKSNNVAHAAINLAHIDHDNFSTISLNFDSLLKTLQDTMRVSFKRQIESFNSGAIFFPTDSNLNGALEEHNGKCHINRYRISKIFRKAKLKYKYLREAPSAKLFHISNCPGHVMMGIATKTIRCYLKEIGVQMPFSDQQIRAMIIREFKDNVTKNMSRDEICYYMNSIKRAFTYP